MSRRPTNRQQRTTISAVIDAEASEPTAQSVEGSGNLEPSAAGCRSNLAFTGSTKSAGDARRRISGWMKERQREELPASLAPDAACKPQINPVLSALQEHASRSRVGGLGYSVSRREPASHSKLCIAAACSGRVSIAVGCLEFLPCEG